MKKSNVQEYCPDFIRAIIDQAIKLLNVQQVILFGSRARGDHHSRSDFDLAFLVPESHQKNWAKFYLDVRESAPTLHRLDLVNLETSQESLVSKIKDEGIILYER